MPGDHRVGARRRAARAGTRARAARWSHEAAATALLSALDGRASAWRSIVRTLVARRRRRSPSASCSACCSSPPAAGACGRSAADEARAPRDAPRGSSRRRRRCKRGLGSPALFGIVQGFVAASIYFALGAGRRARARAAPGSCSSPARVFFALRRALLRRGRLAAPGARRRDGDRPLRVQRAVRASSPAGRSCLDYLILIALTRVRDHGLPGGVLGAARRAASPEFLLGAAVDRRRRAGCNIRGAGAAALRARRAASCSPTSSLQLLIVVARAGAAVRARTC